MNKDSTPRYGCLCLHQPTLTTTYPYFQHPFFFAFATNSNNQTDFSVNTFLQLISQSLFFNNDVSQQFNNHLNQTIFSANHFYLSPASTDILPYFTLPAIFWIRHFVFILFYWKVFGGSHVEDFIVPTVVPYNSITCELYVMSKSMYT